MPIRLQGNVLVSGGQVHVMAKCMNSDIRLSVFAAQLCNLVAL